MSKTVSKPKYRNWRRPRNDSSGVSEAIGTIMLLAIAIALIGVFAAWVETVPDLPEHKKITINFTYDDSTAGELTIDIEHLGGDALFSDETEIRITQSLPIFQSYQLDFTDSKTPDLRDGNWDIGDHWNYTLTGLAPQAKLEIKIIDIAGDRILLSLPR
jgi:FlaG/FlaF family flagellin (archaellin)